jgi:membrane protease YdiL (CAAX protease family)
MYTRGRTAGIVLGSFVCYILGFLLLRRYYYAVLWRMSRNLHIPYIGGYFSSALFELAMLLFVLIMMKVTGQIRVLRAPRGTFFRGLFTGGFMIVMAVFAIISAIISRMDSLAFRGKGTILFSTVLFIFTGMAEEFMFRGITADVVLRRGFGAVQGEIASGQSTGSKENVSGQREITPGRVWEAVFVSGLLFGLMHGLNLLTAPTLGVIVQMISAVLLGMVIAAIYCRSGNIWVVAAIHAFNDIAAGFPTLVLRSDGGGISGIIGSYGLTHLLSLIPYAVVLIVILRPGKMKEIAGKFAPQ